MVSLSKIVPVQFHRCLSFGDDSFVAYVPLLASLHTWAQHIDFLVKILSSGVV